MVNLLVFLFWRLGKTNKTLAILSHLSYNRQMNNKNSHRYLPTGAL
ncbi:hypothetical protein [Clostridium paraputrificum]